MNLPEPIKTNITDESFAGVTYHIRGALVPELQLELSGQDVMFEHHTLLWKETATKIELRKLPGGVKRKIAGLDFFVTKAIGPGRIAFSRDWPGQCIPLHLASGQALNVREHHFLAATDNLDYSFERVKGVRNMLLGGQGFFIDTFAATSGDAVVWVSGQGNVFEVAARRRRADRRRGGRLALQGHQRQARVGLARPEDRHVRRRPQDDLQPLHRARAASRSRRSTSSRSRARAPATRTSARRRRAASPVP